MGKFEHKKDGTVVINSVRMPLGLFLRLEPEYTLPSDSTGQTYIQGSGRLITGASSYRIAGEWVDGDRYISREREFAAAMMTESIEFREARDLVAKIENQRRTSKDKRRSEYPKTEELLIALWKHIVEGKDFKESGIDAIQAIREAIKSKYPEETETCQPSTLDKNSSTTASVRSGRQSSKSTSMKNKSKTE